MAGYLDPKRLTKGVLNPAAQHAFSMGACVALAIAIHDETGWPIVGITDHDNVVKGKIGGGSALHWTVRRPDGKLIDVDGAHDENDLVENYDCEADDEKAAAGTSSRENAFEWYLEGGSSVIPISLAKSFVPAVLELGESKKDEEYQDMTP